MEDACGYRLDYRRGLLGNTALTIGLDKHLQIYLALQKITGLYKQEDLLEWIDAVCDRLEKRFNLLKPNFNEQSLK